MTHETLLTATPAEGVLLVTLNRPPVNAQNAELRAEITEAFDILSDREDVRVIVLTGSGKVFSAGADIRERPNLGENPGAYGRHNRLVRETFNAVNECTKPIVCAINGPAMGAGFAASRTPTPLKNCLRSLANHTVFGFGLYLSALAIALISR